MVVCGEGVVSIVIGFVVVGGGPVRMIPMMLLLTLSRLP